MTFVEPNSAAARAGITQGARTIPVEGRVVHADGDVISGFDGKQVRTLTDLQRDVAAKRPGDRVTIDWWHGSAQMHASIVLGERIPTDPEVCRATAAP